MKKNILIIVSILVSIVLLCGIGYVAASDPATEADPVVTKSYIEKIVLPEVYEYIDEKVEEVSSEKAPTT